MSCLCLFHVSYSHIWEIFINSSISTKTRRYHLHHHKIMDNNLPAGFNRKAWSLSGEWPMAKLHRHDKQQQFRWLPWAEPIYVSSFQSWVKKVVYCNLAVHYTLVLAVGDTVCCYKGMYQRFFILGMILEQAHPLAQFLFVFLRNNVFPDGKFYFA